MSLFDLLDRSAMRFSDRSAVYRGTDPLWTFSELRERSLRLAKGLARRGTRGDRVAVAARNEPELFIIMFATWAAGMVYSPLNAKLHEAEMATIIDDAEARFVFADTDLAPRLFPRLASRSVIEPIGSAGYESLFEAAPAEPVTTEPHDLAWLFYTSGTTGKSKGAMLSHRNLTAMAMAHLSDFENLGVDDSIIHAAALSHGSGLLALPYIARGARQVVPASCGFDAAELLDLCDAHPGCGVFMVPTIVQRFRQEAEAAGRHPKGLRSIIYGGGPMYLDEIKRSLDWFGPVFRQLYAQGECPMTITGLGQDDYADRSDRLLGSVGWARSGMMVRVVDKDGAPVRSGEVGEIVCRGDVVMSGYWRNESATAETIRDGWLWTGDMGSMDESGLLTLRDRSKDVIISGGSNIYPREVEEALLAHPAVREAAVMGRPDPEWGESVVAVIVRETGSDVTGDELGIFCLDRIARFKRPRDFVFVDSLPKSGYGKVLKRELKSLLEAGASKRERRSNA